MLDGLSVRESHRTIPFETLEGERMSDQKMLAEIPPNVQPWQSKYVGGFFLNRVDLDGEAAATPASKCFHGDVNKYNIWQSVTIGRLTCSPKRRQFGSALECRSRANARSCHGVFSAYVPSIHTSIDFRVGDAKLMSCLHRRDKSIIEPFRLVKFAL